MLPQRPRGLARWCGALTLLALAPAVATAQDGQPPTGAPVTKPKTNAENPRNPSSAPPRITSDQVLPGVPATSSSPAPPGTRAVPAGSAAAPTGLPPGQVRGGTAEAPGTGRTIAGARYIEGVVTKIMKPEKDAPGALIGFRVDPTQDWMTYANEGAKAIATPAAEPAARTKADADAKDDAPKADDAPAVAEGEGEGAMDLVFTRNSRMVAFARTRDGVDMFGAATASTPDAEPSGRGAARVPGGTAPAGPRETNFTNLKEGSFVAVRYRKAGDRNEVLNVSLIELPLLDPAETPAAGTAPGARPAGAAGTRPTGAAGTTKARTPTVPTAPVGAGLPR